MIVKRNFHPLKVLRYIGGGLLFAAISSLGAWLLYEVAAWRWLALPLGPVALLGSALAIFIGFRNSSAYARWWEARGAWAGILNHSRVLVRQLVASVQHAVSVGKASPEAAQGYLQELAYRQIAFSHALRIQLRGLRDPAALAPFLPADEYARLLAQHHPANWLLQSQGIRIREGMRVELLGAFDNITIEPNLAGCANWMAVCERIANTPLPRQYDYFTRLFSYAFGLLLPLGLLGTLPATSSWWAVPLGTLITTTFLIMERVGAVVEAPFQNAITDVPLDALCNAVERDLRAQIGEAELPAASTPQGGYLW